MKTYDTEKMQELLESFYNLTNMKICIYDKRENELCFYPSKLTGFCELLRKEKELDEKCRECDRRAFAMCRKTREQYFYTCHAGLLECVSPVLCGDKIIGYIVIGQIKANKHTSFEMVEDKVPASLRGELVGEYEKLPSIDMDKIISAMKILEVCTGYEYLRGLMGIGENTIDVLLDDYINEHLEDGLSVQELCLHFHLSRNELYAIFKECFSSTPAEYIKMCRLKKACKLLSETKLPVNEIAKQCGVYDYNYFSKIFKQVYSVSPRSFRKSKS